jgi:hypothetical protein
MPRVCTVELLPRSLWYAMQPMCIRNTQRMKTPSALHKGNKQEVSKKQGWSGVQELRNMQTAHVHCHTATAMQSASWVAHEAHGTQAPSRGVACHVSKV